eukprot:491511-Lingulodinium_polyedra.AAC.1
MLLLSGITALDFSRRVDSRTAGVGVHGRACWLMQRAQLNGIVERKPPDLRPRRGETMLKTN